MFVLNSQELPVLLRGEATTVCILIAVSFCARIGFRRHYVLFVILLDFFRKRVLLYTFFSAVGFESVFL